ncbi:Conserved oligomeric Golgi complex subunit 2 [Orchesella cincta]|uniref:Conserved oligomeric Golgi complex subunit 2 n=1 Tax=Orchesella cincta TaxID=48709 RepID=A0A1D2M5B0_ORCCI|nr:Conserved oligomeric Golgi complex subunit 2 [Orchesella cincta]
MTIMMSRSRKSSILNDYDGKASFEPQEFLAEEFSVDEFIQNKRTRVPLDVLRDDLGSHLKFLRSSLIELINQDYGQFVNLSSNLVGLDGRIQNIVGPLQRVKNELNGYIQSLDANVESLKGELNLKREIRESKRQLQLHKMALLAIESSEKHIRRVPLNVVTEEDFYALSSSCEEIANAQFLIQNCRDSPMSSDVKKRLNSLIDDALTRMNALLKRYSVRTDGGSSVEKSESLVTTLLYLYVELQRVSEAERIFVLNVLKPVCDEILAKKGNIASLLDEVEKFLVDSPTIKVSKQLEQFSWMSNYHFLSNCVLPHVIGILKKHFPHIWSPSNPDTFHSNWIRCETFIKFLEDMMPSIEHLETFRETETLKDFISKWQFPVYFQLRFHSLAVELESALDDVITPCATSDFKLDSTRIMIKVLKQCWDADKVYIQYISGRFLKASALIVARYIKALEAEVSSKEDLAITMLIDIYCDLKLAELIVQQIVSEKLHFQLGTLSCAVVKDASSPSLMKLPAAADNFLRDFQWQHGRQFIENRITQITITLSSSSISLVTEVPRLYRRTNRELPTKHGEYVESILQPISNLKNTVQSSHQGELWDSVGFNIANQICQRYKTQVDEVLTSVLRMEESLKRLKKVKGQTASGSENNKVLSDDDKIRRQIQIDINYFTQQMHTFFPSVDTAALVSMFDKTNGTS